jgi:hypothetical protein
MSEARTCNDQLRQIAALFDRQQRLTDGLGRERNGWRDGLEAPIIAEWVSQTGQSDGLSFSDPSSISHQTHDFRGRPGFDVGNKAARGMPRRQVLVNPLAKP